MAKTQNTEAAQPDKKVSGPISEIKDIHDLYAQCDARIKAGKKRKDQKIQVTQSVFGFFNKRTRQLKKYRAVPIEVVVD